MLADFDVDLVSHRLVLLQMRKVLRGKADTDRNVPIIALDTTFLTRRVVRVQIIHSLSQPHY